MKIALPPDGEPEETMRMRARLSRISDPVSALKQDRSLTGPRLPVDYQEVHGSEVSLDRRVTVTRKQ
jgi:hypothetical protein